MIKITPASSASEFPFVPLLVLASAYFVSGTSSLSVVGLVAPITADLGVSAPEVAYLVSVFALTFAIIAPLGQIIVGTTPRVVVLVSGMVLMAISSAVAAMAETYTILFLSRVLLAIGAAFVSPICSAIGAGLTPPALQGRAMAVVFSGLTIATVLGIPATSYLGTLLGWRWIMWGLSALSLASLVLIVLTVRDKSQTVKITFPDLAGALTGGKTFTALLTNFLQMTAQFCTYALVAVYAVRKFNLDPEDVAPLLMFFGVGAVLGNMIAGRLSDKIGAENVIWISCFGMLAGFLMLWFTGPGIAFGLLAFSLWSVFGIMFQAPQQQRLANFMPEKRGMLLALNASALYLGMSFGSWISSQTLIAFGWTAMPLGSIVFMLVSMLTFYLSTRRTSENA